MSTGAIESRSVTYHPIDPSVLDLGGPPPVDLYCRLGERYVLYHRAGAQSSSALSRRLFEGQAPSLYLRVVGGVLATGALRLSDLVSLPDEQMAGEFRAELLYAAAAAALRRALANAGDTRALAAAEDLVVSTVLRLTRDSRSLLSLVRLMRHDSAAHTHALNVCAYAAALAGTLGLREEDQVQLCLGALLHDVGKTGVPQAILAKPSALTDAEWAVIRRHPEGGARLLGLDAAAHPVLAAVVLQHHERLDGTGYPRRTLAPSIPVAARVVALVDAYDALTGVRPYRPPLTADQAMRTIRAGLAGQLDPILLGAFAGLVSGNSAAPRVSPPPNAQRAVRQAGKPVYHTAGHVVAACALDLDAWPPAREDASSLAQAEAQTVMILAGAAAEESAPGSWRGSEERRARDLDRARALALRAGLSAGGGLDAYLDSAALRASSIVREHWTQVEAVASALRQV